MHTNRCITTNSEKIDIIDTSENVAYELKVLGKTHTMSFIKIW
ncbi:hypothetical protein [uncultured Gammaproteobacteria bacterium]|nr:hypothetical protein [uncultured Gammaproteobacteria bacterium]